jgi:hypothetical protein
VGDKKRERKERMEGNKDSEGRIGGMSKKKRKTRLVITREEERNKRTQKEEN